MLHAMSRSSDFSVLARLGIHGRLSSKLRRNLDHRLVDQHRHRVQVAGVASSPSRCASSGSAPPPANGSWKAGSLLRSNRSFALDDPHNRHKPAPALPDLVACRLQHLLVGGVLPLHQVLDDLKSRCRSFSCAFSVGKISGWHDGSSTICAKITARAAANGRRAHHRCSVWDARAGWTSPAQRPY